MRTSENIQWDWAQSAFLVLFSFIGENVNLGQNPTSKSFHIFKVSKMSAAAIINADP